MNLRQLAKLAEVSPSAVSLALRNSPKISGRTRKRVQQLAREVGYKPDATVIALMRHLRRPATARQRACFGVISFYDSPRPWENSLHLTRIYNGMQARAAELGYRVEPLWLRQPGMTYRRFRGILEARGIEGLLCFGSPELNLAFPDEFPKAAVVTVGLSIRTPLHRVTSHFYNDTMHLLDRVYQLGYRRPGLVVGRYEDARSNHAHTSAYLGWCEHRLGPGRALPVPLIDAPTPTTLLPWLSTHRPDVLVFVHLYSMLTPLRSVLHDAGIAVPQQLGVAVLSQVVEGSGFSGLQQNQPLMGAWAVELLVSRIANRDFGIPRTPRIEMVEGQWVENRSVRRHRVVNC